MTANESRLVAAICAIDSADGNIGHDKLAALTDALALVERIRQSNSLSVDDAEADRQAARDGYDPSR